MAGVAVSKELAAKSAAGSKSSTKGVATTTVVPAPQFSSREKIASGLGAAVTSESGTKPVTGSDAKAAAGSETKVVAGTETKAAAGSEPKSANGTETKVANGAEAKTATGAQSNPVAPGELTNGSSLVSEGKSKVAESAKSSGKSSSGKSSGTKVAKKMRMRRLTLEP